MNLVTGDKDNENAKIYIICIMLIPDNILNSTITNVFIKITKMEK